MTDVVADMIIRLKNAYLARHSEVRLPASKLLEAIAQVLVELGYAESVVREAKQPQDELVMTLRYVAGKPVMTNVERVSKPGRRIFSGHDALKPVLGGHGTAVLSTSAGIMSLHRAREKKVGGEVLFKIW